MQHRGVPAQAFARDPHFLIAMALGPIGWIVIALVTGRSLAPWPPPEWIIDAPQRLLLLAIAYPVLEELVFRGWVQPALAQRWSHAWPAPHATVRLSIANIVTSTLFTAAHFLNQPPVMALATFAPSLVFGHLRERYDRTLPAIIVHAAYNAGFFLLVR